MTDFKTLTLAKWDLIAALVENAAERQRIVRAMDLIELQAERARNQVRAK